MSKIGKIPVVIKDGVNVAEQENSVKITGPKGESIWKVPSGIEVKIEGNKIIVSKTDTTNKNIDALFGMTRALLSNMVKGVTEGFEKKLELAGVGYRAQMQGTELVLSLGFSHPVKFQPKQGIKIAVVENTIVVSGIDKTLVGETAAEIRAIRPPEPYKGKGIKYQGERIRRKAGKAAKAVGTK